MTIIDEPPVDDVFGIDEYLKALAEGRTVENAPTPQDEIQAAKFARGLQYRRRQIAAKEAIYQAEVDQLDNWLQDATTPLIKQVEYLEDVLIRWLEARLDDDPKAPKSFDFPGATVKRTKPPKEAVPFLQPDTPHGELVAWAEANGVPTKTTVSWADIKKHIESTGDLPDWVGIESQAAMYKVAVNP